MVQGFPIHAPDELLHHGGAEGRLVQHVAAETPLLECGGQGLGPLAVGRCEALGVEVGLAVRRSLALPHRRRTPFSSSHSFFRKNSAWCSVYTITNPPGHKDLLSMCDKDKAPHLLGDGEVDQRLGGTILQPILLEQRVQHAVL